MHVAEAMFRGGRGTNGKGKEVQKAAANYDDDYKSSTILKKAASAQKAC